MAWVGGQRKKGGKLNPFKSKPFAGVWSNNFYYIGGERRQVNITDVKFIYFPLFVQTRGKNKAKKIRFPSKVAKFAGKIGNDLTIIFRINNFFLCDS